VENTDMKNTLYTFSAILLLFTSCGTKDNKNETEHYPTYDTTQKMENINTGDQESNSHNQQNDTGAKH
jgi:hypothetical protein